MIKHLGSVVHIHSSGMVESDKGFKFPFSLAKVGDVMIKEGMNVKVVSKEIFKKEYAPLLEKKRVIKEKEESSDE